MTDDPFALRATPRRRKQLPTPAKPGPTAFLLEQPGKLPRRLTLAPRQADALAQLAGPNGLPGGRPAAARVVNDLRTQGVLIVTTRQPRVDGGSGWTATYRLAAGVTISPEAE